MGNGLEVPIAGEVVRQDEMCHTGWANGSVASAAHDIIFHHMKHTKIFIANLICSGFEMWNMKTCSSARTPGNSTTETHQDFTLVFCSFFMFFVFLFFFFGKTVTLHLYFNRKQMRCSSGSDAGAGLVTILPQEPTWEPLIGFLLPSTNTVPGLIITIFSLAFLMMMMLLWREKKHSSASTFRLRPLQKF